MRQITGQRPHSASQMQGEAVHSANNNLRLERCQSSAVSNKMRAAILVSMISAEVVVGAVQSSRQWLDLAFLLAMGALGWVMKHARWSRAPCSWPSSPSHWSSATSTS